MSRPAPDIIGQTLARNRLGTVAVTFSVLAAAAPLTVVASGATAGWAVTGVVGIPIAYVAVAAALGMFGVGYTGMSRRIANTGAFYSYIAQGLGRVPGVAAAMVALVAYNLMQIGLYGGLGYVAAAQVKTWFDIDLHWSVYVFVAMAVIAAFGVLRVEINGRVLAVALVAEICIAAVYAVVQLAHPAGGSISLDALNPSHLLDSSIGAGLATAIAGFVGFESTAVYAEETKDPRRTVPRATYLALLIIGLLYALCSWAMTVAAGPANVVKAATEQSTALTFNLAAPYLAKFWINAGQLLLVTSLFAALLSFHNTVARYSFALGRERVLPAFLGRTSSRNSAPVWGSVTQTVLAAAVIGLWLIMGWDPFVDLFFGLTVTGGFGILLLMTFTCLAVVMFFARNPQARADVGVWTRIVAPLIALVALGYTVYLTVDQYATLLGVTDPNSNKPWLYPTAFLVVAVGGALLGLLLKLTRPGVYAAIGQGGQAVAATSPTPAQLEQV
jgi:amino acid transporter